ncbi:MAG: cohesin domain-containing protein, partial [Pyrinomonadaceae bacterium]
KDLRKIPVTRDDEEEVRLTRHPPQKNPFTVADDPYQIVRESLQPDAMPTPLATFPGISSAQSACGCLPPDTDGDVGPNHYIQTVNSRVKIISKTGTELLAPTTFNTFFSALGLGTPCGNNQNRGDPVVFYDHMSDRWVVSDFAFAAFPGTSFYQCVGVSKTPDPVGGGWWLYAVQVDPANPAFLGDYPKFGMWPDAYYMSVNMFSNNTTFNGVRVFAFDRNAMMNGQPANTIAFSITPANLGDQYSLVPASFRTGSAPPAGQPEWFMNINSSITPGTVENQVFVRRFHVDFATPSNSTFGIGAAHGADGIVTVNGFVDAFTSTASAIVPQNGTTAKLDTLGDKLMAPLVYQNLGGVESIYSSQTVNNNQNGTGPTGIRWHKFNMTGNTIPATPAQQQTFNNAADGLWRFMPSINVDSQGNMAIAYSTSAATAEPSMRYAGRLAADPPNTLAQGEAVLQAGGGHQTSTSGRWGDYSSLFVDPANTCTFWHTAEYYSATTGSSWNTRIGSFQFPGCTGAVPGSIAGNVSYAIQTKPVPGVLLSAAGSPATSVTTDSSGSYLLGSLGTGSYNVTPSKARQQCGVSNGIFASDASKVSQFVVNSMTFTPDQLAAAKVAGNAFVSSADASLIARRTVGLCSGPPDLGGNWVFTPANKTYPQVLTNFTGENYTAILMGDVDGDWNSAGPNREALMRPDAIRVSVPTVVAEASSSVNVPLTLNKLQGTEVGAYQFDIEYDPAVIEPADIAANLSGTKGDGLSVVYNVPHTGLLKVAVYGATPANGDGIYANLKFTVVGSAGTSSRLTIRDFRFNDVSGVRTVEGLVTVAAGDGKPDVSMVRHPKFFWGF